MTAWRQAGLDEALRLRRILCRSGELFNQTEAQKRKAVILEIYWTFSRGHFAKKPFYAL
jgi:hypothetical protein